MTKKKLILICGAVITTIAAIAIVFILTSNDKNKVITYKITFDSNGGNNIETQIVQEGETATKPKDPLKEGYLFVEWLYNNETFNFAIKIEKDINLIAKWQEVKEEMEMITVTFNTDEGTTISNQIIEKGDKITKPESPIKEGYIFKGWFYNEEEFNFDTLITENIEIKAKWEEKTKEEKEQEKTNEKKYKVTFDAKGGTSVKSQTIKKDSKVIKPTNPTKDGYAFINWTLNDKIYNFDTKITQNITLVANWRLFGDVNNDNNITSADLIELSRYIEGMTELTKEQKLVADVNNDSVVDDVDVQILAKYISDGGTNENGYNIKLPYNSGKKYTIKYNLNGGTIRSYNIKTYAAISLSYELKNPTKEGYVFIGWTGSNGTTPQTNLEISEGTTGNLEYIANWLLYGDINNDNNVDLADLIELSSYLEGKTELTKEQKLVADVNLDGKVDNIDEDIIAKYISDGGTNEDGYNIKLPYTS